MQNLLMKTIQLKINENVKRWRKCYSLFNLKDLLGI